MTCLADTSPAVNDCGHAGPYGTDRDGKTSCYDCIHIAELAEIHNATPGDRHIGYISGDGQEWTNWPGGVLGQVIHWGARHHWSRSRHYITVVDQHGRYWSGTGDEGMWATLRLTKGKVA